MYSFNQFLFDSVNSILNQTYTNWELLIIDNHSKDATDELVKSFKNPQSKGTIISKGVDIEPLVPCYIFKQNLKRIKMNPFTIILT